MALLTNQHADSDKATFSPKVKSHIITNPLTILTSPHAYYDISQEFLTNSDKSTCSICQIHILHLSDPYALINQFTCTFQQINVKVKKIPHAASEKSTCYI